MKYGLLAGFARPPALVLAAVMLLVGGVAILGRHGLDASAPAIAPLGSGLAAATPVSRKAPEQVDTPTPAGNHGVANPPPVRTAGQDTDRVEAGDDESRTPRVHAAPAPTRKTALRGVQLSESAREPVRASDNLTGELAGAPGPAYKEPQSPPLADAGESAKDVAHEETVTLKLETPQASPGVPLAQLYKQCESAARRGDCVAVRVMVSRITETDRTYRSRVAKDSPVGKCLAE